MHAVRILSLGKGVQIDRKGPMLISGVCSGCYCASALLVFVVNAWTSGNTTVVVLNHDQYLHLCVSAAYTSVSVAYTSMYVPKLIGTVAS